MTVSREIDRIAEELFLPDASAVDRDGRIPDAHFAALAASGLYGAFAPTEVGGAGLSASELCDAIEQLASGCLASTLVWIQHFGLLGTVLDPTSPAALRERLLAPVVKGGVRGGIALAGLLPGPPLLRAARVDGGWRLEGESPWVSGWGYVQLLQVAARVDEDYVLTAVIDAVDGPGLTSERMRLTAADASMTVRLRFDALFVPDDRVVRVREFDPNRSQNEGLRGNGSLALGITRRCCAILGPSPLDDELRRSREALDEASQGEMPRARAAASALAVRAAAALTVTQGSAASVAGTDPERLAREAWFTLVFGSRSTIKAALREMLMAPISQVAAQRG
jgi:alkylation response protein AidB-like acyl-CoA dehydrogenase